MNNAQMMNSCSPARKVKLQSPNGILARAPHKAPIFTRLQLQSCTHITLNHVSELHLSKGVYESLNLYKVPQCHHANTSQYIKSVSCILARKPRICLSDIPTRHLFQTYFYQQLHYKHLSPAYIYL